MNEPVVCDMEDGIAVVTLNRPQARNPISDTEVVDALVGALQRLGADPRARVIVLTGAGPAFSSGGNVKTMLGDGGLADPLPSNTRANYRNGIQRIPLAFERLDLPIIAAVNGPAVGAGCDLACMCDIRLAGESASFAASFVRLGLVPGDGGAWLLPRIVGYSRACEMAFTGEAVGAKEALAIGLVSRVIADGDLLDAARSLARRIAANPGDAVRMTKRLLMEGRHGRLDAALELSAAMQALAHATPEHRQALERLLAGRHGPERAG